MKITFENFGAIKKANLEIKPFTIISGENETGKSFILKLLYAIAKTFPSRYTDIENNKSFGTTKIHIKMDLETKQAKTLTAKELLEFNFKNVFQINNLKELININAKESIINIEGKLYFHGENRKKSKFIKENVKGKIRIYKKKLATDNILLTIPTQDISFIPTPLILDLEKGIALYKEVYKNNLGISDIYWDTIAKIRNIGKATQIELKSVYKHIKEILNGSFDYKTGEGFILKKGRKIFKTDLSASGIKTLGIIQMLIERNLLKPYSTLIIEEPEVHLHPSLRFKLVDILKELSNNNVFVIISTHSPEILRYVEYLINTEKLKEENTSFLHLELGKDGSMGESKSGVEVLNKAIMSLTQGMFDLMIKEGLEA